MGDKEISILSQEIYKALGDKRWDYRTAKGIADETGYPLSSVARVLSSDNRIIKRFSALRNEEIYSLKSEDDIKSVGDFWKYLRRVSADKLEGRL